MTGFLDHYEGSVRVDVGDPARGYYVELWEHASQGNLEEAERSLTKMRIVDGKPDVDSDTTGYRQRMVLAYLKEWNLDDDGVVWAYTLESVKRLPSSVFKKLWKLVDDFDAPENVEAQKRFPDEGSGGDPERDERPAQPRQVPARGAARAKAAHQLGGTEKAAS